ncbi:hypothetical protein ATN84_22715 [Paramesorhizobium deserti]|uniref:TRAP transporter small permease protein n=1 Tax=Paramesorhizobium deserti TaxID=1494590 RepID=A0A135HNG9_9HYPH|nr:TRAP transporter small permease [Paramesorhizobium deserti]KXF74710.1 hypothetical protein ATN84_22715 [Paramesorhizobium deserti]
MTRFLSVCRFADKLFFWLNAIIVGAILAAMSVLVFYGIVARYVLDAPPFWGEETARFMMFFLVLTGSALAIRLYQHPRLTMFADMLPVRGGKWLSVISDAVVLGTLIVLLVQGIQLAIEEGIMRTPALRISYFWIYLAYPVGAGLGLLQLIGAHLAPKLAEEINDGGEGTH